MTEGFSLTMFTRIEDFTFDEGDDIYAACYVSKHRSRLNVASVWVYTATVSLHLVVGRRV